jgi:hypothetical protein
VPSAGNRPPTTIVHITDFIRAVLFAVWAMRKYTTAHFARSRAASKARRGQSAVKPDRNDAATNAASRGPSGHTIASGLRARVLSSM